MRHRGAGAGGAVAITSADLPHFNVFLENADIDMKEDNLSKIGFSFNGKLCFLE